MIGGSPMMSQPQFMPQPMQTFPGPPQSQVQVPQPWPPPRVQPAQPPQVKPASATAQQPILPAVVRGKLDDDPDTMVKPLSLAKVQLTPVSLPSPEELGVAFAVPAKVDWNATRERLNHLGAIGLQMVQMTDGSYRIAFVMRTNQADHVHHIEATAATEAEAVALAMTRAEQWAVGGGR
jgi:hypothetical protein